MHARRKSNDRSKQKEKSFGICYSVYCWQCPHKGGATVKLSALVMGLANMAHKQIIKGLIFLAIEIAYIAYMVSAGAYYISMLPHLAGENRKRYLMSRSRFMNMLQATSQYYYCYMAS